MVEFVEYKSVPRVHKFSIMSTSFDNLKDIASFVSEFIAFKLKTIQRDTSTPVKLKEYTIKISRENGEFKVDSTTGNDGFTCMMTIGFHTDIVKNNAKNVIFEK